MKTKTITKTNGAKKEVTDPLWEDIKKGLESAVKGPLTVWKPPFK